MPFILLQIQILPASTLIIINITCLKNFEAIVPTPESLKRGHKFNTVRSNSPAGLTSTLNPTPLYLETS